MIRFLVVMIDKKEFLRRCGCNWRKKAVRLVTCQTLGDWAFPRIIIADTSLVHFGQKAQKFLSYFSLDLNAIESSQSGDVVTSFSTQALNWECCFSVSCRTILFSSIIYFSGFFLLIPAGNCRYQRERAQPYTPSTCTLPVRRPSSWGAKFLTSTSSLLRWR